MIEWNDKKAIQMAIELILMRELNCMRLSDIEEALEMEFDDFCNALDTFEDVKKEYKNQKGL